MAKKDPNKGKGGGNRKKGRNFRSGGKELTITKYRARHGIAASISRKDGKAAGYYPYNKKK